MTTRAKKVAVRVGRVLKGELAWLNENEGRDVLDTLAAVCRALGADRPRETPAADELSAIFDKVCAETTTI